jgi:hypothetical protein
MAQALDDLAGRMDRLAGRPKPSTDSGLHDGWKRDRRHHHQSDNLRHSDWCRIGL